MRVGVIADVHGNLVALDAVLSDMPAVDGLVCAGDVVGYNPWHADCVAAMRGGDAGDDGDENGGKGDIEAGNGDGEDGVDGGPPDFELSDAARVTLPDDGVPTVMGNHDRAVAFDQAYGFNDMAAAGVDQARETCAEDELAWLSDLPEQRVLFDGRMKVVHGHPDDPDRYTYPEEYHAGMLDDEDVLVMGHTHVQGHEIFDDGLVMNPGSVGQPRDGDPRAAYAVLDFDEKEIEGHRVEYDVDHVVDAVRAADLPLQIGTRLRSGQ
jgi:putative phosphoesterase